MAGFRPAEKEMPKQVQHDSLVCGEGTIWCGFGVTKEEMPKQVRHDNLISSPSRGEEKRATTGTGIKGEGKEKKSGDRRGYLREKEKRKKRRTAWALKGEGKINKA